MKARFYPNNKRDIVPTWNRYDHRDPTGLLISEKRRGVRVTWDGAQLKTRTGGVIAAPKWWTDKLPLIALDGELCAHCKVPSKADERFVVGLIQSADCAERKGSWMLTALWAFDVPRPSLPFADRVRLYAAFPPSPVFSPVHQFYCIGRSHLASFFECVVNDGGEGVVLRDPDARYEVRRSDAGLKYKPASEED